jgi:hypothetical protein
MSYGSSLLFIISALFSFYYSKSIFWKISNTVLIPTSCLCNGLPHHEYIEYFCYADYFTIVCISISSINNFTIRNIILTLLIIEYTINGNINYTKMMSFIYAVIKGGERNKYIHFFSVLSMITYVIRDMFDLFTYEFYILTWVWHLLVAIILSISSFYI